MPGIETIGLWLLFVLEGVVLFLAASTRYAAHMHNGLSTIQQISQNRLNGMPKGIG